MRKGIYMDPITLEIKQRLEQLQLEQDMVQAGVQKYAKQLLELQQLGIESNDPALVGIFTSCVFRLEKYLNRIRSNKKPGKNVLDMQLINDIPTNVLAYITTTVIFNSFSSLDEAIKVEKKVADRIQQYRIMQQFKDVDKKHYEAVFTRAQQNFYRNKRRRMLDEAEKKGVVAKDFKTTINVGRKLVHAFIEATGAVSYYNKYHKKRANQFIKASDVILESLGNRRELIPMIEYAPMVAKPEPWTETQYGGYYSTALQQPFIRKATKDYLLEVDANMQDNPIFDAVNTIQDTAYRVNKRVLAALKHFYYENIDTNSVTKFINKNRDDKGNLPKPDVLASYPMQTDTPEFDVWKQENPREFKKIARFRARQYKDFDRKCSKGYAIDGQIRMADKYKDYEQIYMPVNLDWRTRNYPIPTVLSMHGDDVARGLLEFGRAVPYGPNGYKFVKIATANAYGNTVDKQSYDERVAWVDDNIKYILDVAETFINEEYDTQKRQLFEEADDPWQFLAACIEIYDYHHSNEGEDFKSHFILGLDATQSGIQNLSALALDVEGAKKVNLIKGDKPADIYQEVSDLTNEKIRYDLDHPPSVSKFVLFNKSYSLWEAKIKVIQYGITIPLGRFSTEGDAKKAADDFNVLTIIQPWAGKVNRKYAKKPCMTKVYSATLWRQNENLEDFLQKQRDKSPDGMTDDLGSYMDTDEDRTWRWGCIIYLSKLIWDSISEVVNKPSELMDWFQEVGKQIAKTGLFMYWTTPMGVIVHQSGYNYRQMKDVLLVNTYFERKRITRGGKEPTTKVKENKSAQAFSPNYIHSLDASVLMKTVLNCKERGVDSFCAIHDSFGVHAGKVEILNEETREAFIDIYSKPILENLYQELCQQSKLPLPRPPALGNLDITVVRDSEYFFS